MVKDTNKHLILLFAIFIFAFLYRFLLMTRGIYPPGADIGLHNSVIYSIINQGGNVDFLYNYYQMGGGLSLTFPGYHLFVAQIMLLTGMSEYLVHTVVVSLFSSVTVLASYLITRAVWKESAAIVVVFLMTISRVDIEMLLWGGYPNVITLLLVPVTFYLYMQKKRFTNVPFFFTTSMLIASIFLTHSLTSLVFVSILFSVILFSLIFSQKIGTTRLEALSWLLPVIFGAIIVLPYLTQIVPAYLTNQPSAEINQASASTQILPLELVLSLFVVVGLYFLLSKKYHNRYFTVPTVLLALWIFVPAVFTQGYLFGLYTDYNRFLYFAIFPVIILSGLFVEYGSGFFAKIVDTYHTLTDQLREDVKKIEPAAPRHLAKLSNKLGKNLRGIVYAVFLVGFLLCCFFLVPIFSTPSESIKNQTFYQAMNYPLYQAMEWVKVNTPVNATFVTTAYYGWWFGGFAQRPTWSASDPQFLFLSRELPIAQLAANVIDTDYLFENSFSLSGEVLNIQVREDGGYLARHNPQILTNLNWTYFPYPFFNFNSNQTTIRYEVNGVPQATTLDKLPVLSMYMENSTQSISVFTVRGNEYFTCTQETTVYQGSKFVNITTNLETVAESVSLTWFQPILDANALLIGSVRSNTVGFLSEGVKAFGQVIFNKNIPNIISKEYDSLGYTEVYLDYNLGGKKQAEIQLSLTTYSATNDPALYADDVALSEFFNKQIDLNLVPEKRGNLPLPAPFNYQMELKINDIDYVVVPHYHEVDSNAAMKLKFANDPLFNLVFINNEVAIFEVT